MSVLSGLFSTPYYHQISLLVTWPSSDPMDPLGTAQAVLKAIEYLRSIVDKVKQNKEECKRLCDHASSIMALVQAECTDGVPAKLAARLGKLERCVLVHSFPRRSDVVHTLRTLRELSTTIEALASSSRLKRILGRRLLPERLGHGCNEQVRDIFL